MDVTANNVSNVNTDDFKSSSVTFKDSFVRTIRQAGLANENTGGTNPMQVGSGVSIGSIRVTTAPGAKRITGDTVEIMSNTDLGREFTDKIVTYRGFQANARAIPVANSMFEDLVNMRR